jgi:hypothetical protein
LCNEVVAVSEVPNYRDFTHSNNPVAEDDPYAANPGNATYGAA